MASIKNLKKEINYVLGDLVDIVYVWEITNGGQPTETTDGIVDSIYSTYDEMLAKINNRGVENRKAHLKQVRKDFEDFANQVVAKINDLN
ncbi:hypothetical protein [Flavobacterium haoranii]|uniref:Uncharacterized protein n=1 Tax=Flavobacterium haoranii TaxID=683124 RepID=A0A1M6BRU9_9FLAO|nr:hypothetical protein [Flavobacterium haoranii]MDK2770646.1 hypothetical protein [Flavobacterium sp.]SHI51407.1 hypothetical protein SAMN05444337_0183 [Flavobacterium haoranii]